MRLNSIAAGVGNLPCFIFFYGLLKITFVYSFYHCDCMVMHQRIKWHLNSASFAADYAILKMKEAPLLSLRQSQTVSLKKIATITCSLRISTYAVVEKEMEDKCKFIMHPL